MENWSQGLASSEVPALGFLELNSISRGLFLTDVALKKAPVKMIASEPVSSGKHVLLFFGDVASVEEAHREALQLVDGCLVREVLIPGVHPELVPFLDSVWKGRQSTVEGAGLDDSAGVVESSSLAGAIVSADQALKSADVGLCRLRLGQGIGGRAYFVLRGRQEEVEAGMEAAELSLREIQSFERMDLIARPQAEALKYF